MGRSSAVACALFVILTPFSALPDQPRQASFHVTHAFTVKVPQGAKVVRIWIAVPQEDASSVVRNLEVS